MSDSMKKAYVPGIPLLQKTTYLPLQNTHTDRLQNYEKPGKTYNKVFTQRFDDPNLFVEAQPVEELLTQRVGQAWNTNNNNTSHKEIVKP